MRQWFEALKFSCTMCGRCCKGPRHTRRVYVNFQECSEMANLLSLPLASAFPLKEGRKREKRFFLVLGSLRYWNPHGSSGNERL